jgi:TonB family protein
MSNNFSLILTKKRIKMITRNEKAKGLWWRLLATLPVLAILMIANTKVTAQEQKAVDHTLKVSISPFEVFDDDGAPMQLIKDTIFYEDDGTYVKFETSDGFQPETGEPCKKLTITSYNADGTPRNNFFITETERRGDTSTYSIEPFTFTLSEHLFEQLLDIATSEEDTVYQIVEEMPKFPGGEKALMDYVSNNVKYPEEAKNKNIAGRVFVSFVVEKDGSIGEVKVLRGIGGGCDEEAVRVIKGMPKWKPGIQKGKPVRVSYQIPIYFKLDTPQKTNSLVGSVWEGTGTGTKGGVTYTWHSILQFNSENEGLLIEKLVSQKKNEKPVVEFENVAMDFEYAFDGKKTGAITPKNGDGTYMDEQPPEGFILSDDGKTLVLNFYTATEDTGIKFVTYTRR